MTLLDLLKGKKVRMITDAKVEVVLEIESVKQEIHAEDLEPATQENDWYPEQRRWVTYNVRFTNGHIKIYSNLEDIDIL